MINFVKFDIFIFKNRLKKEEFNDQLQSNMRRQERRFNTQYNKTIIKLIRQKISPLHKVKKHAFLPMTPSNQCKSISAHNRQVSLLSLPSGYIPAPFAEKLPENIGIMERVRQYLQNKRRENNLQDQRVKLGEFIQIFERPMHENEIDKRESIEVNIFELSSLQKIERKQLHAIEEKIDLNDDQRSILNAKIRRKLNHKKMIDLFKRY